MDEKKPADAFELDDEQLAGVAGGQSYADQDGKHYKYIGNDDTDPDWNNCYLCPNCGRPVHYGGWGRYFCDPCDENWYYESKLRLNLSTGVWQEMDDEQYKKATKPRAPGEW